MVSPDPYPENREPRTENREPRTENVEERWRAVGNKPLSRYALVKKKKARLEMRIGQTELDALKREAGKRGIPHS